MVERSTKGGGSASVRVSFHSRYCYLSGSPAEHGGIRTKLSSVLKMWRGGDMMSKLCDIAQCSKAMHELFVWNSLGLNPDATINIINKLSGNYLRNAIWKILVGKKIRLQMIVSQIGSESGITCWYFYRCYLCLHSWIAARSRTNIRVIILTIYVTWLQHCC